MSICGCSITTQHCLLYDLVVEGCYVLYLSVLHLLGWQCDACPVAFYVNQKEILIKNKQKQMKLIFSHSAQTTQNVGAKQWGCIYSFITNKVIYSRATEPKKFLLYVCSCIICLAVNLKYNLNICYSLEHRECIMSSKLSLIVEKNVFYHKHICFTISVVHVIILRHRSPFSLFPVNALLLMKNITDPKGLKKYSHSKEETISISSTQSTSASLHAINIYI